jgi:translation initiation factor IF-2
MPNKPKIIARPPVVSVMGHVDHGKSTLLDYIRKSNIVSGESGGITQHIAGYEVLHENSDGDLKKITFLDTPGHAAFTGMRIRGANAADIAILVVSAEDGVKAQTMEAYDAIIKSGIPYIVAINKIDKPGANLEKTKNTLLEHGIYLEGMGGAIPWVAISAKNGDGINELLDLIIFVSEFNEMKADLAKPATGFVLESNRDPKRGITATLIIKEGTLTKGTFIVVGGSMVPVRIMENFLGEPITVSYCSSPVKIVGFDSVPEIGEIFETFTDKKSAEKRITENKEKSTNPNRLQAKQSEFSIPLIIKADVLGSIEAIEKEVNKLNNEENGFYIINTGVGSISENDLRTAATDKNTIIVGFNTIIDKKAEDLKDQLSINIETFNIIYKLTEYLEAELEKRRPRKVTKEITGALKVIKVFSQTKEKQVVGCRVEMGSATINSVVSILRRENEIGTGKITEMQHNKSKAREVFEGDECGLQVESKITIAPGDILQATIMKTV